MDVLWIIVILLVVLWAMGYGFSVGGGLIHLLLLIAVVVLLVRLISGARV